MQRKNSGRMTTIPQLDIPEILVEEDVSGDEAAGAAPRSPVVQSSAHSSVDVSMDGPRNWLGSVDLSLHDTAWHHPLSFPRSSSPPSGHQAGPSAFSFELQEDDEPSQPAARTTASGIDRDSNNLDLNPSQVRGMLDDSVWGDSIRRSVTVRRSQEPGYRYGDLD